MNAKPDRNKGFLPLDDKRLKFGRKTNTFTTHDEGLAKDIDARFGRHGQEEVFRATVVEVPQSMTKVYEGTRHEHNYQFAVPDLPWKKVSLNDKEKETSGLQKSTGKNRKATRDKQRTRRRDTRFCDEKCQCEGEA